MRKYCGDDCTKAYAQWHWTAALCPLTLVSFCWLYSGLHLLMDRNHDQYAFPQALAQPGDATGSLQHPVHAPALGFTFLDSPEPLNPKGIPLDSGATKPHLK